MFGLPRPKKEELPLYTCLTFQCRRMKVNEETFQNGNNISHNITKYINNLILKIKGYNKKMLVIVINGCFLWVSFFIRIV